MESVEEDPMIQILIEPLNELLERSRSHQNPMESIDETLEAPLTQPIEESVLQAPKEPTHLP